MKPFSEIISKIIAAGGLFKYQPLSYTSLSIRIKEKDEKIYKENITNLKNC